MGINLNDVLFNGDTEGLESILKEGTIEVRFKDLEYLIQIGKEEKILELLKIMEKHGVDITNAISSHNGNTVLMLAVRFNRKDVVKYLVKKVDINVIDFEGNTALHYACNRKESDSAAILLEHGASCVVNNSGRLPIQMQHGTCPFQGLFKDIKVNNEISYQSLSNYLNKLEEELKQNNPNNQTILHLAARDGSVPLVRFLLKKAAIDVNAKDAQGNTAIDVAILRDKARVFKELYSHPSLYKDETLLYKAIKADARVVGDFLINVCEVKDTKDKNGNTPVHVAAGVGSYWLNQFSPIFIFSRNKQNNDGNTPLHIAVVKCDLPNWLIRCMRKEELNIQNNDNETALHIAVMKYEVEVVEFLVGEMNAEGLRLKDKYGLTALDRVNAKKIKKAKEFEASKQSVSNDIDELESLQNVYNYCTKALDEIAKIISDAMVSTAVSNPKVSQNKPFPVPDL